MRGGSSELDRVRRMRKEERNCRSNVASVRGVCLERRRLHQPSDRATRFSRSSHFYYRFSGPYRLSAPVSFRTDGIVRQNGIKSPSSAIYAFLSAFLKAWLVEDARFVGVLPLAIRAIRNSAILVPEMLLLESTSRDASASVLRAKIFHNNN